MTPRSLRSALRTAAPYVAAYLLGVPQEIAPCCALGLSLCSFSQESSLPLPGSGRVGQLRTLPRRMEIAAARAQAASSERRMVLRWRVRHGAGCGSTSAAEMAAPSETTSLHRRAPRSWVPAAWPRTPGCTRTPAQPTGTHPKQPTRRCAAACGAAQHAATGRRATLARSVCTTADDSTVPASRAPAQERQRGGRPCLMRRHRRRHVPSAAPT